MPPFHSIPPLDSLLFEASGSPSMHGARFFEFPSECQPTHLRVQKYIDQLDSLDISQDQRFKNFCHQKSFTDLVGYSTEGIVSTERSDNYSETVEKSLSTFLLRRVAPPSFSNSGIKSRGSSDLYTP